MSDGLNEFETSIEGDAGSIDCNIFGLSPAPLQCAILGIQIEFGGRSIERSVLVNYGGLRVVLIEHGDEKYNRKQFYCLYFYSFIITGPFLIFFIKLAPVLLS